MPTFMTTTWRTLGNATATHDLFTLSNASLSGVTVRIRRLVCQCDPLAANLNISPQVKTHRQTGSIPGGGTTLSKRPFDNTSTSSASIVARGATASDGGTATAITGVTPGAIAWQQYINRASTHIGQILSPDNPLLPNLVANTALEPWILHSVSGGSAVIVRATSIGTTNNPATYHWFVQCVWEEI